MPGDGLGVVGSRVLGQGRGEGQESQGEHRERKNAHGCRLREPCLVKEGTLCTRRTVPRARPPRAERRVRRKSTPHRGVQA